jgi:AraC-like DNA-binding protein
MAFDQAFTTLHLPPQQRVARWTEEAADRFVRLDFRVQNPDGFIGSMLNRDVSDLGLTRILSRGHSRKRITRSRSHAAAASEAFFLVSLQLEGSCTIRQAGREARPAPGQFALYDTRRPYELVLEEDYQQAVLRVPCRTLGERLPGAETLTASAVAADGLPARLLAQLVRETCNAAPPHPGGAASRDVADALLALLAGGLRELREDATPGSGALARVKAYVAAHLSDPDLSVTRIAAALGLSRSYLHKLFRAEGRTLERWIWSERLAACERALRDPRQAGRTLTEIAYAFGFSDAAHFSRSFQRRCGMPPSVYRRQAAR